MFRFYFELSGELFVRLYLVRFFISFCLLLFMRLGVGDFRWIRFKERVFVFLTNDKKIGLVF